MAEDIIIRYRAETEELKRQVDALIAQQEKLQQSVDGTDKEFKDTSKSAKSLGNELGQLDKKGEGLKDVSDNAKTANKSFTTLGRTIARVGTGIAAALGTAAFAQFARNSIKAASDFEALSVSFETFLGSAEKAEKVLADLDKFSVRTPFSPEEVQQAGKALLAFGIQSEDLIETLRRIGDVSAATGKNFNELAVIYGKAKVQGTLFAEDINQLTASGIPIIEELADQFGRNEDEIKKLGSEGKITFENLEQGFKNLTSEGGRFFGLTDRLADTTTGKLSTLEGRILNIKRAFGELLQGPFNRVLDILNGVNTALESSKRAFQDAEIAVQNYETSIAPLIVQYEELVNKTTLTNDEQEDLRRIIEELGKEIPTAISQFDEYGNALEINTEKARAYGKALEANLRLEKEALFLEIEKERAKQTELLTKAQEALQANLERTGETYVQIGSAGEASFANTRQDLRLTDDEIRKLQETIKNAQEQIEILNAQEDLLLGRRPDLGVEDDLNTVDTKIKDVGETVEQAIERVKNLQRELKALGETRLEFRGDSGQQFLNAQREAIILAKGDFTEFTTGLAQDIENLSNETGQDLETSTRLVLTQNNILIDGYIAGLVRSQLAIGLTLQRVSDQVKESQESISDSTEQIALSGALALTDSLRREIDLLQEFGNSAVQIFQGISDSRIRQIDLQEQRFEEHINKERDLLEESREQRLITESEYQEGIAELNKKEEESQARLAEERAKIAKRQAVLEKTAALLTIAVEAAQAVAAIQAQAAILLANPLTAALAANAFAQIPFVLGSAAAQAAVIAAQPLPQFAKGTKGKKDSGMAIVGEEGPEMTFLPKGAKVLPAKQTRTYSQAFDAMYDGTFDKYIDTEYEKRNSDRLIQSITRHKEVIKTEYITPVLQEQKRKYEQVQSERFADNVAHSITVSNSGLYWDLENIRKKGQRVVNADDIGRAVAKEVGKVIQSRRRQ